MEGGVPLPLGALEGCQLFGRLTRQLQGQSLGQTPPPCAPPRSQRVTTQHGVCPPPTCLSAKLRSTCHVSPALVWGGHKAESDLPLPCRHSPARKTDLQTFTVGARDTALGLWDSKLLMAKRCLSWSGGTCRTWPGAESSCLLCCVSSLSSSVSQTCEDDGTHGS